MMYPLTSSFRGDSILTLSVFAPAAFRAVWSKPSTPESRVVEVLEGRDGCLLSGGDTQSVWHLDSANIAVNTLVGGALHMLNQN